VHKFSLSIYRWDSKKRKYIQSTLGEISSQQSQSKTSLKQNSIKIQQESSTKGFKKKGKGSGKGGGEVFL